MDAGSHPLRVEPSFKGVYRAMLGAGMTTASNAVLQAWTASVGLSWDEEHECPEPRCGGCGIPINVADGEEGCLDCWDCDSCCWDNHGDDAHAPVQAVSMGNDFAHRVLALQEAVLADLASNYGVNHDDELPVRACRACDRIPIGGHRGICLVGPVEAALRAILGGAM
jgi:hypothetical protein